VIAAVSCVKSKYCLFVYFQSVIFQIIPNVEKDDNGIAVKYSVD